MENQRGSAATVPVVFMAFIMAMYVIIPLAFAN